MVHASTDAAPNDSTHITAHASMHVTADGKLVIKNELRTFSLQNSIRARTFEKTNRRTYTTLLSSPHSLKSKLSNQSTLLIMKTRKKTAQDNDEGATSPSVNVEPDPSTTTVTKSLTIRLGPLVRKSPQSALNAVDGGSHQHLKHGRSNSDADTEVTVPNVHQPSAKRMKNSNTTLPVEGRRKATCDSRSRVIPPRSPLSQRTNRVINPGAPDQKRAQRTSEEVAAAAKQKENLRLELEELERKKIQTMADMHRALEEEERLDDTTAIWHITDLAESKTNPGDNDVVITTSNRGSEEENVEMSNNSDELEALVKMVCITLMQR